MKTLCINLDSRPDRWEAAQKEFARVGLTVERFPAFIGDNRPLAFNKSVYGAMKQARTVLESAGDQVIHARYEDLLLFEDDVVFEEILKILGISNFDIFIGYFKTAGFMTVHLGANIIGTDSTIWRMPEKYTPAMAKLHNCWQSHATLYSAECVEFILNNFSYYKDEYEKEGCQIFDEWLRLNVLNQGRSYLMNPMICSQRPGFSDIWRSDQDYSSCHTRGNKWLKDNL